MKTGIYGGTFNPIHLGHVHILEEFIKRLGLQRVLLIPARDPPHKNAPALASGEDRLEMCRLAAEEISGAFVEVCPVEMNRPGKSYTADTLEELRSLYPQEEFYLLMGEDMFLTVDTWRRPEVICREAALCASPRSADGLEKLKDKARRLEREHGARCFVEDIPYFPASSTEIRELAGRGESIRSLVPRRVEQYLREHRLYGMPAPRYQGDPSCPQASGWEAGEPGEETRA